MTEMESSLVLNIFSVSELVSYKEQPRDLLLTRQCARICSAYKVKEFRLFWIIKLWCLYIWNFYTLWISGAGRDI